MEQSKKRTIHVLKNLEDNGGYVEGTMAERISLVWELTKSAWAFTPGFNAQSRLQKSVTHSKITKW